MSKRIFKKAVATLMAVLMTLTISVPAFAQTPGSVNNYSVDKPQISPRFKIISYANYTLRIDSYGTANYYSDMEGMGAYFTKITMRLQRWNGSYWGTVDSYVNDAWHEWVAADKYYYGCSRGTYRCEFEFKAYKSGLGSETVTVYDYDNY